MLRRHATQQKHSRSKKEALDTKIQALQEAQQTIPKRLKIQQENAHTKAEHWQKLYDSTPDGQAELQAQIDQADGPEAEELKTRLEQAKQLRKEELAAARERNKGNGQDQDGSSSKDAIGRGQGGLSQGKGTEKEHDRKGKTSTPGEVDGRGHSRSHGRRTLLVGGQSVSGTVLPRTARHEDLKQQERRSPDVYELDQGSAEGFRNSISALKENNDHAASVYVYDAEEYADMRLFTTENGKAGFALKGDDIVSVFVRGDAKLKGSAASLMAHAVAQGGRRLDCFETRLPEVYAGAGFHPVARLKWNEDYAPEGWEHKTYAKYNGGRPDVVFMAYKPGTEDSEYKRGEGVEVDDYDDAGALIDKFLAGDEK